MDQIAERYHELRSHGLNPLTARNWVQQSGAVCGRCHQGWKTRITLRRDDRPGREHWTEEVCHLCWIRLVDQYTWSGARDRIDRARWGAVEDRDIIRGLDITLYPRRGQSEAPLCRVLDEWRLLQRVVGLSPATIHEERWRFILEAWILWMSREGGNRERTCQAGKDRFPEFSWTDRSVRSAIDTGRRIVGRRVVELSKRDRSLLGLR